jgi:tetraacyldisaccharide 4'-kinase
MPLSWLYGAVMALRERLYEAGVFSRTSFPLPCICVGNLSVGGTGKTPHIEYLMRLLRPRWQVATLSRGYGRLTKGPLVANSTHTASDLGDEPMQFYAKFGQQATVAVAESRVAGMEALLAAAPGTQAVLLDDAYQHLAIRPSFQVLLTDYSRPFFQDYPFPAGRLREWRGGARRADAVVVSKCPPHLAASEQARFREAIARYAPQAPVFFTGIRYGRPERLGSGLGGGELPSGPWLVATGIARPEPMLAQAAALGGVARHAAFRDHHRYTPADVRRLVEESRQAGHPLLLTEKDAVKWMLPELRPLWEQAAVFALPIEVYFLGEDGTAFDRMVAAHVAGGA